MNTTSRTVSSDPVISLTGQVSVFLLRWFRVPKGFCRERLTPHKANAARLGKGGGAAEKTIKKDRRIDYTGRPRLLQAGGAL